MDWATFLEGYAVGTAQMVAIDCVILSIVWPLRAFIGVLKQPLTRARIKVLIGVDLTPLEVAALKETRSK